MTDLVRGSVVWFNGDPVAGREQGGRRPGLVVASNGYLARATTLVIVVPVTTVDRGWPNHIRLDGALDLDRASYAMTEHVRTISRDRVSGTAGQVDAATLGAVDRWLKVFLDL
ncbi:type II toxin-antitoxin system PemK/MazF family toxin [Nocardioides jejuensis]|uniref:type II toxin-antitoxin system PemK/MazF family toxin n=1 Tax=Nocardioides jejuensis TaxID=2502782 RepID=UPI0014051E34|nr:type II toxin-antitoxin system PemK/MazF family toxin [Nocardioides jejuensis]